LFEVDVVPEGFDVEDPVASEFDVVLVAAAAAAACEALV
jgi:hypothetical protein